MSERAIRYTCITTAAIVFCAAGLYLLLGNDFGKGIIGLLIAAVVCRILLLNIAERRMNL